MLNFFARWQNICPKLGATITSEEEEGEKKKKKTHLELGVGPAGDLNNHVEDGLLGIGIERNVVEGRDGDAILLNVHTVLERVRRGDLAGGVGRHCVGVVAVDRREVAGNLSCAKGRNLGQ